MKKQFVLFILMLLPIVAMSQTLNDYVGVWEIISSTDKVGSKTYTGLMVGETMTINANGTYSSSSSDIGKTGTYTLNGNNIKAKSSSGQTIDATLSLDALPPPLIVGSAP